MSVELFVLVMIDLLKDISSHTIYILNGARELYEKIKI